ncbi:MAG: ADOP family duplicated permease [Rhodanobacter sp.]
MNIWLSEIWRAWRASLRRPGFMLLAVGVLALGVGSCAAVFTLIDNVLLRPLPYTQPSQLVAVGPIVGGQVNAISPQQYQHLAELDGSVSHGLVESFSPPVNIAGTETGVPELVPALHVDRGLLPTLGVTLALGRNFNEAEDRPHGPSAVILTWGFWQHRYGGKPDAIGGRLQVEGVTHTIVGVLPADFRIPGVAGDIMLPVAFPANSQSDGTNYLGVVRLAAGATTAGVGAQVNTRLHAMYVAMDDSYWKRAHFGAADLKAALHDEDRPVLLMFMVSALLLLLIALVNLTNLSLLRALSRTHDVAVRGALGAPPMRLALPALAEGLLIGLGGTLLGLALATFGLNLLQGFMPLDWLAAGHLHVDASAWVVGLLLGILGALATTMLGLWRARTVSTIGELREGGRSGLGRHSGRLGRILVVAQVALATALLSTAGLFLHTLYAAAQTPLGFSSEGILTFELAPVKADYPDAASVQTLSHSVLERLRILSGVVDATATTNLPAGGPLGQFNMGMHVPGGDDFSAQYRGVDPGFFALFKIPIHRGRAFARSDRLGGEAVAVVNEVLAKQRYGGHALGQLIQQGSGADAWSARIVGVVGDTSQMGPLDDQPPMLYLPLAQMPDNILAIFRSFEPLRFALKVHGEPESYRDAVHAAIAEVAPNQPIANLQSMHSIVGETTAGMRLNLLLVGIFAALALLLAAAGMYAVMATAVAAREREFGVRTALGASPGRLTVLVLRGGLLQIVMGLGLGVLVALALSRVLGAVMEQVGGGNTFDPLATFGVCVLLAISGLLACLLPALRAGRTHPMRALRGE